MFSEDGVATMMNLEDLKRSPYKDNLNGCPGLLTFYKKMTFVTLSHVQIEDKLTLAGHQIPSEVLSSLNKYPC